MDRNIKRLNDLTDSENVIGQIYPILRDAEGKIIDGYHRLDIDPNWKSITLDNVKTDEDRLIVSIHANLNRRLVSKNEKIEIINRLAEIYYQQGLRPDVKVTRVITDNKRWKKSYENTYVNNQILNKLDEVMKGTLSRTYIQQLLYPKYKYMEHSEVMKKVHKKRRDSMTALQLIMSSHGKALKNSYGDDIFNRLKNEMMEEATKKARTLLRFDRVFIEKVKAEIKEEYETELKIESNMISVFA